MATELEDRLARLGDAAGPGAAATARARTAALDALPVAPRRRGLPRRRVLSVAFAVAGTVAIAAVLVLSLPRGGDHPVPAGITLVATPPSPGAPVDAEALETTARMIDRRAQIMRIDGADAEVVDGDIVLHLPDDAPPGALRDLTAPGEFAMYDGSRPKNRTTYPIPPPVGPDEALVTVVDAAGGDRYLLVEQPPALTNADIAGVATEAAPGGEDAPFLRATLTAAGDTSFHELTRAVAQRGAIEGRPEPILLVLDGRLLTNPTIDPQRYPDGITSGTLTIDAGAQRAGDSLPTAAQIQEGPLPVVLTPAG